MYGNSSYLVQKVIHVDEYLLVTQCGHFLCTASVFSSFPHLTVLNVHESCIFTKYIHVYGNFWHVKCDLYNHLENRMLKHNVDHPYCSISLYLYKI